MNDNSNFKALPNHNFCVLRKFFSSGICIAKFICAVKWKHKHQLQTITSSKPKL